MPRDRGAVEMSDVFMAMIVLVAIVVTAPIWYRFIGMAVGSADPFSALLLSLFLPLLVLALFLSVGVSARRRLG